nr:tyrosine-type recombinase/integrase [Enterocloster clostridioformis]
MRNLRMSDIDWNRKKIHLVMGKTGQPIDIPLLDPVGWSIIDYLKNGRPATSHDHVFVRHRAPFGPLGGSGLGTALRRYIVKAGIDTCGRGHHGLHSLRSTLAGNMLTSGAPLPVISQTLGHQDIKTTELYLKVDVEHLRRCALDPDAYQSPATETGGVHDA